MIVICCGCDKTGKTTLVKKLAEKYDAEIIKTSQPQTDDAFKEYVKTICELDLDKDYVFDRFHLGEIVYGPLYRNKSDLTASKLHYLEMKLLRYNAMVIYCSTDSQVIINNFVKDMEEFTKPEDVLKIMLCFENALNDSILPKFYFNYNKITDDKVFHFVNTNKLEHHSDLDFIGTPSPSVLLVGDRLNERSVERNGFRSVFCSPSGLFLVEALKKLCWLDKAAIINSDELSKNSIFENVCLFNAKIIISLGKNAWKTLSEKNINSYAVSHPQFAKRFYGPEGNDQYANELAEKVKYGLLFKDWDKPRVVI